MLQNKTKDEQTKHSISREIEGINKKIRRLTAIIKCGEGNIISTIERKTSILETKIKRLDRENETLTNYIAYQNNRSRQFKEIIKRGY